MQRCFDILWKWRKINQSWKGEPVDVNLGEGIELNRRCFKKSLVKNTYNLRACMNALMNMDKAEVRQIRYHVKRFLCLSQQKNAWFYVRQKSFISMTRSDMKCRKICTKDCSRIAFDQKFWSRHNFGHKNEIKRNTTWSMSLLDLQWPFCWTLLMLFQCDCFPIFFVISMFFLSKIFCRVSERLNNLTQKFISIVKIFKDHVGFVFEFEWVCPGLDMPMLLAIVAILIDHV